ncbi:D-alanine--D-alanine ligase family protein [Desulfobulbus alkaliphilus]|uniref:D-alanine--D-alanine ligase family protein n=1 Tax=Desulfobulbus alkaliphilus TaxID=869814 RepID=UPI001964A1F0|nr:D-alanine--D-alanine ligase [Desulfobulbus alkaliphilus]MBM9536869.1 D-alanine--D-alanine ligase [Desulfobulbus alkaliphilus]
MMAQVKKRLALIAGGTSDEREVSLRGAIGVEKALDPDKYEVVRYDPATDLSRIAVDAAAIDVAFLLLHGVHGEDGTIQGFLDLLGIPYQGAGVLGSALAMDKHLAKTLYAHAGLPVAPWVMVEPKDFKDSSRISGMLTLPYVVKPVRQGSSIGMTIVREAGQLAEALRLAGQHDSEIMVEQFINGRELTVGVIGNDDLMPLPLIEIIPDSRFEFFNYEAKYQPGASEEICPAPVSEEVRKKAQQYAMTAHRALRLRGYSRTDMILAEDDIYLLETNTIPGMTPTSLLPQAAAEAGLSFSALLDRLIELALEKPAGVQG